MACLATLKFERIYLDYLALAEKFNELILKDEYQSIRPQLEKALKKHYFPSNVDTPDKKYKLFMDLTVVWFFPFTFKDIEIIDMENQVVYDIEKRRTYKKFREAALSKLYSSR